MKVAYELEVDDLALALTKPALKLGVPISALYLSIFLCLIGWMVYQVATQDTSLIGMAIFISVWLLLYIVVFFLTFQDVFGLTIFWLNITYFRQHKSHYFWANRDSFTS